MGRIYVYRHIDSKHNYNESEGNDLLLPDTTIKIHKKDACAVKIAITGGAGFIGSHLAQAYLNAGHDVLILDNLMHSSQKQISPRARFYQVDVRDEKLRTILQMERPDIVSHHVSLWETPTHFQSHQQVLADADVYIRGLLNVLEGCVSAGVEKILFASNGNSLYSRHGQQRYDGFGVHEQSPLNEDTLLNPKSSSDIAKATGEWYVRYYAQHYHLNYTILRYADVYGETSDTHLHHPLTYFIQALTDGQRPTIRGTGNTVHDHIFIDDVVQANLRAVKHGKNQTLHISTGRGYTLNQLYMLVASSMKSFTEPLYLGMHRQAESEQTITLDNTRAQQVLGWQPHFDLCDGITEAIIRYQRKEVQSTPLVEAEAVLSGMAQLARV